jgi:L-threonylcarbamoyladenylate synthase
VKPIKISKPSAAAIATRLLAGNAAGIAEAAAVLRAGGLVAFPTETVYGLGADATNARAVAALYAAKGRPAFNPLIAHVSDMAMARAQGLFDHVALALAGAFWPGPLTVVVPAADGIGVCDLARSGLPSVALRMPSHALARDLIAAVGRPVVAPSANRSGHVSPTRPAHVMADLDGRIDAVIDGGPTAIGLESTIIACLGGAPRLLRSGGVTREALEGAIGAVDEAAEAGAASRPVAPGQLASHYAPRARVRLDAAEIAPGEAALLFGAAVPAGLDAAGPTRNLSPAGDLAEAATNLFAHLRALDEALAGSRDPRIAVAPVPMEGLGEAINDRLRRAAAAR